MLFLLFQLLTAVAFFGINFIPQLKHKASVDFHCNDGASDFRYCPNGTEFDTCSVEELIKDRPGNDSYLFNCDFTCRVSENWMLDFICNKWQNNTNCDSNRKEFTMRTENSLNHIEQLKDCLFFENTRAQMIDGGRAIIRAIYQNTLIHCSRQNHDRFHRKIEIRRAQVAASEIIGTVEGATKHEKEGDKPARRHYVPVQEDLTGVYGAFTYSWRCLFMSFDYQDWVDPIVYFGFYVENVLIIGFSYVVIHLMEYDLSDKTVYYVYSAAAGVGMVIAIILKYTMVYTIMRKKLSGAKS